MNALTVGKFFDGDFFHRAARERAAQSGVVHHASIADIDSVMRVAAPRRQEMCTDRQVVEAVHQAPVDLLGEGRRVRTMLKNCLDALVNRDTSLSRKVLKADDEVDRMHREVYRAVKDAIRQNPLETGRFIELLNTSRQLGRIADHAVNIAEDVIYVVEGRIVRHRPELQTEPQS